MIQISSNVQIPDHEVIIQGIRATGPGGQNVNKVSSAVHLFFHVPSSSLPDSYKKRLLARSDSRLTEDGTIVLKVQEHRTQAKNREIALERLVELIRESMKTRKKRKPTRPSRRAKERRIDAKKQRGQLKAQRKNPHI